MINPLSSIYGKEKQVIHEFHSFESLSRKLHENLIGWCQGLSEHHKELQGALQGLLGSKRSSSETIKGFQDYNSYVLC